jgi:hypothetical protein
MAVASADQLDAFLDDARNDMDELSQQLTDGEITVDEWYAEMERIITEQHFTAAMMGEGSTTLSPSVIATVLAAVAIQRRYLTAFADELRAAQATQGQLPLFDARARMYAESAGASYWAARYREWPLPAMPGDGTTQCLTNCRCRWEIDERGNDNADCYWELGVAEHCQTCIERARLWNPLKVRDGVVQL